MAASEIVYNAYGEFDPESARVFNPIRRKDIDHIAKALDELAATLSLDRAEQHYCWSNKAALNLLTGVFPDPVSERLGQFILTARGLCKDIARDSSWQAEDEAFGKQYLTKWSEDSCILQTGDPEGVYIPVERDFEYGPGGYMRVSKILSALACGYSEEMLCEILGIEPQNFKQVYRAGAYAIARFDDGL